MSWETDRQENPDEIKVVCVCQGAVQGPEEFAEGFVIGVRSLLGHTVGKKARGMMDAQWLI